MFDNIDVGLVYLVLLCILFGAIFVCMVITLAQRIFGKSRKTEDTFSDSVIYAVPAVVVDGRSEIVYYHRSPKFPKHYLAHYLTFRTEDGRVKEYEVPKHIFKYGLKHRKGMLLLSDDRFFDFGEGRNL
ncbi:MAG: DUF2500 family protein [Clostridia bacterium]|nr:DUF2500 family protein [Clostridia bacterium]